MNETSLINEMANVFAFVGVSVVQSIDLGYLEWQYECIYSGRGRPLPNNATLVAAATPNLQGCLIAERKEVKVQLTVLGNIIVKQA